MQDNHQRGLQERMLGELLKRRNKAKLEANHLSEVPQRQE
jgi:hypothetical protein